MRRDVSNKTLPLVAMAMGGPSAEREVSLSTGRACAAALRGEGYTVIEIDAGKTFVADLESANPDVVFNALHGRWGEDGCVQGIFEWMGLPYTHSGVLASALAMDKERTKAAYAHAGLPVLSGGIFSATEIEAGHVMQPPYVVKPNNEGSSVGIYIVDKDANGPPKLDPNLPSQLMAETYAPGRDLTCTVQGDRALTVTDIITDGWYDYNAKYSVGGSSHEVPANLPKAIFDACMDMAKQAHDLLGCRGVTRTDFRWDDRRGLDGLFVLETNTQPGMTGTSLSPEQAAYVGQSFGQFCDWIVKDASCNR